MADELENHSSVVRTGLNDATHKDKHAIYHKKFGIITFSCQLKENSDRAVLVFSVNMSGCFQGYPQMTRRDNVWVESIHGNNPWGRTFKVKWLQLHNLPFQRTLHLKNPLNDYKPIKISRDCQELTQDIGEALCALLDDRSGMDDKLKRCNTFGNAHFIKRPCREPPAFSSEVGYLFPAHPAQIGWGRTPIAYPVGHYQLTISPKNRSAQIPFARSPYTMLSNPVNLSSK